VVVRLAIGREVLPVDSPAALNGIDVVIEVQATQGVSERSGPRESRRSRYSELYRVANPDYQALERDCDRATREFETEKYRQSKLGWKEQLILFPTLLLLQGSVTSICSQADNTPRELDKSRERDYQYGVRSIHVEAQASGRVPIHVEKSSRGSERGRETRVWLGFRG
jgi:hypothetical protein